MINEHGEPGKLAEAAELRTLLFQTARSMRRSWMDQLEPWDLTPFQWRALRALWAENGAMRPGEIADRLRIAPRSATEVIDLLEDKGLVQRGKDPDDRRATRVALTIRGREVAEEVLAERDQHSQQFFAPLTKEEQDYLETLLLKLS